VTRRRDLSILWFATAVVSLAVIGAWMLGRGVGRTPERPDPKALAAAAAESAVTRAERALAEGSDMERRYAAEFLGSARSGRSAVGPLMKAAAQDPSAEVRAEAVRALGRIADPRAVDTLTRAAANDESSEVRSRAIRALGAMGAAGAADVIIDGLDSAATCDDATEALLDLGAASVLPLNDRVRSRGGMLDESVLDAEEMDMTITIRALIAAYKSPPREG
jgi:HEAT repeat protein